MDELLHTVVQSIDDKKGSDIVVLDISQVASFTDYFIICTGTSTTQMQTVVDTIRERLRESGERPAHMEGYNTAEWILLDYGSFIVHVFSAKARAFYDLERLWSDGRRIDVESPLKDKPIKSTHRKVL
ncbi:MAG: ribosome silencing factor [Acidobacteria bacterium]|nr:ribosome silencing factor [Acidobacteriota bacterium]MBI3657141.1 ribosome silencing factor [Acidobacteriota bacterium]